jgi:hypothetical protein
MMAATTCVTRTELQVSVLGRKVLAEIAEYKSVTKAEQFETASLMYFIPCAANLWGWLTKKNPTDKQIMKFYWYNYSDSWFDPVYRYNHVERRVTEITKNLGFEDGKTMQLSIEDWNMLKTKIESRSRD